MDIAEVVAELMVSKISAARYILFARLQPQS